MFSVEFISFCAIEKRHLHPGDDQATLPDCIEDFTHVWQAIRLYHAQSPEQTLHMITAQLTRLAHQ